jgi:hypothetical protein
MKYLLLTLITFSFLSFSQEEPTREYAPGVWELTTVDVDWGNMGDYMDGLEQTWVPAAEILKEMGRIDDYSVHVSNNSHVYLSVAYPNYAAMDPASEEEQAMFQEKFRKIISEQDQTTRAQGYEDIREIVRVEMINRINFN